MTIAPPDRRQIPSDLVLELSELLFRRHATELLPAVLSEIGPYAVMIRPGTVPGVMPVTGVQSLIRLFGTAGHLALLGSVVALISPWMPAEPPRDQEIVLPPRLPGRARFGSTPTNRELQVLAGMANGLRNSEIGVSLCLSEDTIKTHASSLFGRIGARDRAHAVRLGIEAGWLPVRIRKIGAA